MLIYDKSEQLTLYIWDRVAVIGGVEGDKMIEECQVIIYIHVLLNLVNVRGFKCTCKEVT